MYVCDVCMYVCFGVHVQYICVCVYVYGMKCVSVHVIYNVYVCPMYRWYVCMYVCMSMVCVFICPCTCMCGGVCMHMCTHVYVWCVSVHVCGMCVHVHVHCVHVHVCVCGVYVSMYLCV